ncbi:MAG: NAD+ synthase, partial [Moraxellaceae bacterium]|nr:NAD+ synthase [Moraxellaceae bacterium]
QAREQGADIAIFPEMALLGYPPQDLLLRANLAKRVNSALAEISQVTDIIILMGYPHVNSNNGNRFNSMAILHDGQQKGFYHKQYLPNYGCFDESRYFTQGNNQILFDYKGITIGLLIGEDLWQTQLITTLKKEGADMLIAINASPFVVNQPKQRKAIISEQAKQHQLPIVYVNAVGGQDDLVFDGGSLVVQANGEIAHQAPYFLQQMLLATYDCTTKTFDKQNKAPLALSQDAEIYQALVVGLRDYVNHAGFNGVIVGLSGDINSALSLCIAVDALGADKVFSVMLPYKNTTQIDLENAQHQARRLNVSYSVCPIFDAVDGIRQTLTPIFKEKEDSSIERNIQARARATILMALSNKFGHLLLTSVNKSDLAIGDTSLYGDMVGGFSVLKDVYKSDVYKLASYRNRLEDTPVIPKDFLKPTQTDYQTIDSILNLYIEEELSYPQIVKKGFKAKLTTEVLKKVDDSEYKRSQSAIGTKINEKSFGRERRYPLINYWSLED